MGCNHSRNNTVGINPKGGTAPGTAPGTPNLGTPIKQRSRPSSTTAIVVQSKSTEDLTASKPPYENRLLRRRLLKQNTWTGSHDSINTLGTRGGSATSKFSSHSGDSGFGDHKFITEDSRPEDVREVEDSFKDPSGVDGLGVVGTAVSGRGSAKGRTREEQNILEGLRQEGLITKPVQKATSGLSFEVVAADVRGDGYLIARKPPARLAKLEKRRKKKKTLTEEELKAKMERVERKRQEREQAKLEKIRAITQKSDVQNALDSFAESQKEKEEKQKTKEEIAEENREKRMKEMRDKLKEKQEHAAKVRHRRKTTEEAIDFSEYPPIAPNRVITEDTVVGPAANHS